MRNEYKTEVVPMFSAMGGQAGKVNVSQLTASQLRPPGENWYLHAAHPVIFPSTDGQIVHMVWVLWAKSNA
jgi:hypothetical protein